MYYYLSNECDISILFSFQEDAEGSGQQIAVINAHDDASDVNVGASTSESNTSIPSDTCEESTTTDDILEREIVESETDETLDHEDVKNNDTVCIFCNKRRKKVHGREQTLQTCVTQEILNFSKVKQVKWAILIY